MDEPTRKPGEIAKMLGITTATVRNYVKEFREFLSPAATAETNRRFTPEDIKVLRVASELLREGFNYPEVRERLNERLPMEGEIFEGEPEPETPPPPETPQSILPLEFFSQFVEQLNAQHQAHLETLKEENERLRAELNYARLPFFVKWFRKPPA